MKVVSPFFLAAPAATALALADRLDPAGEGALVAIYAPAI